MLVLRYRYRYLSSIPSPRFSVYRYTLIAAIGAMPRFFFQQMMYKIYNIADYDYRHRHRRAY